MAPFKELDPLIHSQLRLSVMSILVNVEEAEFVYLKEQTEATAGNLSVQINKLKDAGYISIQKGFNNNYPQTICRITPEGRKKFEEYIQALGDYFKPPVSGKT
jgi:DNA-binding MarR family transcriptional regulator